MGDLLVDNMAFLLACFRCNLLFDSITGRHIHNNSNLCDDLVKAKNNSNK